MTTFIGIVVIALAFFYVGFLEGEGYVREHTVVRQGFPSYSGVYYGECASVRDVQTDLVGRACATGDKE